MDITKFLHSCLLIENEGRVILTDPGNYTYDSKVFPMDTLEKLDYILITHEHGDHMHLPFLKELLQKFPQVKIITTNQAASQLEKEGIKAETNLPDFITTEQVPHEKIFMGPSPENLLMNIDNYLSHPGDSLSFDKTCEVLALPVTAPWGSTTQAVDLALKLKPKKIIPIHDWHWKDEARAAFYERLKDYFGSIGIEFVPLETGVKVTV